MEDVNSYLAGPFNSVEGWCVPQLWQTIEPLHTIQTRLGVAGRPIAEIGVYQGKFFIGHVKTQGAARGNFAIDVFDMQEFNLDGAGKGSLAAFRANLAKCNVSESAVEIERADSTAMGGEQVARIRERAGGGFSMFSVDGCHLPEHTVNDINVAMELTLPQGIIFVDDYYNANWPGVQEGVAKLYFSGYPRFVPLLYTCNKLALCHLSYHAAFLRETMDLITKHRADARIKRVKRFGYDTLTISPNMRGKGE